MHKIKIETIKIIRTRVDCCTIQDGIIHKIMETNLMVYNKENVVATDVTRQTSCEQLPKAEGFLRTGGKGAYHRGNKNAS